MTLRKLLNLTRSMPGFLTIAFLAGFNYGGVLVIYATAVALACCRVSVGQATSSGHVNPLR